MQLDYEKAVREALTRPGKIHAAYTAFWNYSFGNQILAIWQLGKAEPINTYPGWQKLGRQVRKGEKAITLLMPVTATRRNDDTGDDETRRFFIARPRWFGLSQTEGAEYIFPEKQPEFELDRALCKLEITRRPFEIVSGNTQGYAIPNRKIIAVSPIAFDPERTALHETAHVLLHGDHGQLVDGPQPERAAEEVEAELTAYLVKAALGIERGQEFSRGYLQNWLSQAQPDKVRFPAVFGAVDRILKAGRPAVQNIEP